jgi:hypothetical protein
MDSAAGLTARFGVDAPAPKLLGEGLAPPMQVGLARVQALAVPGFGSHADVHMRVGLVLASLAGDAGGKVGRCT